MMNMAAFRVLSASAVIFLSYFLPCFHLDRWKKLSSGEAAVLSLGAGALIFGAASFVTHAIGINQRAAHLFVPSLLVLSAIPLLRFSCMTSVEILKYCAFSRICRRDVGVVEAGHR